MDDPVSDQHPRTAGTCRRPWWCPRGAPWPRRTPGSRREGGCAGGEALPVREISEDVRFIPPPNLAVHRETASPVTVTGLVLTTASAPVPCHGFRVCDADPVEVGLRRAQDGHGPPFRAAEQPEKLTFLPAPEWSTNRAEPVDSGLHHALPLPPCPSSSMHFRPLPLFFL